MSGRFAAVILAAGRATRFGGGKLVAPFQGAPLAAHAARAACGGGLAPVIVVRAPDDHALEGALAGEGDIAFVAAAQADEGLAHSLRAGLAAAPPDADGVVVLLADMPLADAALVRALCAAWTPEAFAVAPVCEGRRGNPVLLSAAAVARAGDLNGDRGFGALLDQRAGDVRLVPWNPACLADVDTPADLSRLASR